MSEQPQEARPSISDAITKAAEIMRPSGMTDEQVWVAMWTCVANCFNCQDATAAARWADKGLQQFRERFPCTT